MTDPTTADAPHGTYAGAEIDLRQLAHVLWRYRISIIAMVVLGGALGFGMSYWGTRYRSEGLFLTPKLKIDEYKPYEAALASKPRLQQFLKLSDKTDTRAGKLILATMERDGGLQGAIRPAFAFTDQDAKLFGVRSDETQIVGIRLSLEESEPAGESPIRLLGEYVRDTKIKIDMDTWMRNGCADNTRRAQNLRSEQIQSDFDSRQNQARAEILRGIITRNPQAAQNDSRQVVSLAKGAERFLSPVAQLVGVEVELADLKLGDAKRNRERIAAEIKQAYYCRARDALEQPGTGRAFMEELDRIHASVFEGRTSDDDAVEATSIALAVERELWNHDYFEGLRFVTSPEGTETRIRRPGLKVGLALGAVLGGLLGVLLALGRAWWRANRAAVVAEDPD